MEQLNRSGSTASIEHDSTSNDASSGEIYDHGVRKDQQKPSDDDEIARSETKNIIRMKVFVIFFLIACAVGVAVSIYLYMRNSEIKLFEDNFDDSSEKVLDSLGKTLDLTLGAVDAYIVSLVSFAHFTNSTWPYVTVPDYAVRLAKIRSLSRAVLVSQYHFVADEQRDTWLNYTFEHDAWVKAGIEAQKNDENFHGNILTEWNVSGLWANHGDVDNPGPYLPQWQTSPVVPYYPPYNWDAMFYVPMIEVFDILFEKQEVVVSGVANLPDPNNEAEMADAEYLVDWVKDFADPAEDPWEPFSEIFYPIVDTAIDEVQQHYNETKNHTTVGIFAFTFFWRDLLQDILPTGTNGVVVVLQNECDQVFTYQIDGPSTTFLGRGDLHDSAFDNLKKTRKLSHMNVASTYSGLPLTHGGCQYTVTLYAAHEMESQYISNKPILFTIAAVCIFVFTSLIFLLYDWCVEKRQTKVMRTAMQTSAVVSSLFPSNVRDRLFPMEDTTEQKKVDATNKLKSFMRGEKTEDAATGKSKPIADLFPETTVLFADIAGFTAWSSTREPTEVFVLLETLYGSFDKIANKKGVFKVETIGDSYVAVTGLPEPRLDHAVVMAKFARDIRDTMCRVCHDLSSSLGPDTSNLALRIGLHSGPVTAGVLRGEKSRFQLFGDTVNTASRMESNGIKNKIQVSESTANLLFAAERGHWLKKREDMIEAKGKGKMQTYWLDPKSSETISSASSGNGTASAHRGTKECHAAPGRLVEWNYDLCECLISKIIARRNRNVSENQEAAGHKDLFAITPKGGTILDEVSETIELSTVASSPTETPVALSDRQRAQLREYISMVAALYNANPFHNFGRATHVTMAVVKFFGRIASPDKPSFQFTQGIVSDPLTEFACVFSAMVHDLDHPGLPNSQFAEENVSLATIYKGRSISEQHAVDVAWQLLMRDDFKDLRLAICASDSEIRRFRQLVINCVIATDLADPTLQSARCNRWTEAFESESSNDTDENRKAVLLIEYLMQASDIVHTMQHWQVYRQWDERLFEENYVAYTSGRSKEDPSSSWYEVELSFFDNVVIPLAQKFYNSGILGDFSKECLTNATKNREEWQIYGNEMVTKMVENLREIP